MNRFADDPVLQELRGQLRTAEELLAAGIFSDPASGRACLAGRLDGKLRAEDLYFEAIAQIYLGWPADYIVNGVLALLDAPCLPGPAPRDRLASQAPAAGNKGGGELAWPFLAQTALLVQNAFGEAGWLTQEPYFSRLHAYLHTWLAQAGLAEGGAWNGMPARGTVAHVDLLCYLVRECRAFARLADMAGYQQLSSGYARYAFELAARVRDACWDEQDGFFYHADGSGRPGRLRRAAGFAALWAGVARTEQVKRLVYDHLFNAAEFWSPYPVAGAGRSLPRGAAAEDFLVSVPVNYMLYQGLRSYGYRELASVLAHATHGLVRRRGPHLAYRHDTGAGEGGPGGQSLVAYFLPFEEQCGVELMNWRSKDPAREPGGT